MKKLLIVDDEFIFRQGLRYLTDWEKHGYEIAGEAANGQEALLFLQSTPVDLVLCDVVMPVMDGVLMVQQLSKQECPPVVVMLSNYDEFDNVRLAFKYGAVDYLLKSRVSQEELLDCLRRALPALVQPQDSTGNFFAMVRQVLDGYDEDGEVQLNESLQQQLAANCYTILLMDRPRLHFDTAALLQMQLEQLEGHCGALVGFTTQGHALGVLGWERAPTPRQRRQLLTQLQELLPQCPTVLGDSVSRIVNLREQAEYLYQLCSNSVFYEGRSCFDLAELVVAPSTVDFDEQGYFSSVEFCDWGAAAQLINDYLMQTKNRCCIESYSFKRFLENTLYRTIRLTKNRVNDVKELDRAELRFFKNLDNAYTFGQVQEAITTLLERLCELSHEKPSHSSTIQFVRSFIEENYTESITLNHAAERLHLNYSYLSSYISQNTGLHFNELLNEVRIRHAKELLLDTDWSVSSISESIGFTDQSYFGKVFKKLTGVTPLQYRNKPGGKPIG